MATVKFATARIINNNTVIANVQYSYVGGEGMKRKARAKAAARYWNMVAYTEMLAFILVCTKEESEIENFLNKDAKMETVKSENVKSESVKSNKEKAMKTVTINQEHKIYSTKTSEVTMLTDKEAYCYNMYCSSRDKSVALKAAFDKMGVLANRVNKGQMMMKDLYVNIVKEFGMMVVTQKPEVSKGTDLKFADGREIDPALGMMSINMASTRLVYSHYKDGNPNYRTTKLFTSKFGYEAGIEKFNMYSVYAKKFNNYLSVMYQIFGEMKLVSQEIKDARDMENVMPVVNVEERYDAEGHRTYVCPHCGEEVRPFFSKHNYSCTESDVIAELRNQTYDLGNGRTIVLDSNGDIVSDSDNAGVSNLEAELIANEFEMKDLMIHKADMSVFDEDYSNNDGINTFIEGAEYSDFAYDSITNEDMELFYSLEAASQESIDIYNENMKADMLEREWNKYRSGMSLVEAGWSFAWNNDNYFKAGGRFAEFYNYEESVMRDAEVKLDFDKCIDILNFNKLAGNAFDIDEETLDMLRHNEFVGLVSTSSFADDYGTQDLVKAKDTVKGAEKKVADREMFIKLLTREVAEILSRPESTWSEEDRETLTFAESIN